jgi:hypothetical protein
MLSVLMLNVVMLSVVMLSVLFNLFLMLHFVMLSVVILNVVMLNVVAPLKQTILKKRFYFFNNPGTTISWTVLFLVRTDTCFDGLSPCLTLKHQT